MPKPAPLDPAHAFWHQYLAIAQLAVAILQALFLVVIWYKIDVKFGYGRNNRMILFWGVLSIIMFICSSLSGFLYFWGIIPWQKDDIHEDLFTFFQTLGQAFLYMLFITRIRLTFQNTKYEYPMFTYIILYVLIVMFTAAQFVLIVVNWLYFESHDITYNFKYDVLLFDVWIVALNDAILCFLFLWLVFKKLWQLTKDLTLNRGSTFDDSLDTIVATMSKITILSALTVVAMQILIIWLGIMNVLFDFSTWYWWIAYVLVRNITSSFCILLSFEFMGSWYLVFCGKLDRFCMSVCKKIAKEKLEKTIQADLQNPLLENYPL